MTFPRIVAFSVLLVLAGDILSATAAEARASAKKVNRVRKRSEIVQIADEQLAADTEPAQMPKSDKVSEESPPPYPTNSGEGSGRSWTLRDLEAVANSSHPLLQRDLSRIDSARGDSLQAGLMPNPRFDSNNPQVFAGQNSLFNVGIMQELPVMGKKRLDRAAAIKVVQQNEFAYVFNRFSLLTDLRKQFYVVLAAQRRAEALTRLQKITSSSVEAGKELDSQAGEIPPIDVLVLELDNEKVEADLENAVRRLRGARKQLAAIVGDQSIVMDEFRGSLFEAPPQYDEQILTQFSSMDSAYVQIKKLEIDRNEVLLQRAIVEPYPNPTLGPAYQWGLTSGSEQYWLSIQFPIPTWDRNQGNIQSQRADLAASRMDLEATKLDQLRRVAKAYSDHRAFRIQATKYKNDIIPHVTKTLVLAKDAYRQGLYDFARFLQVQRSFVELNMAYIDILENVWTTAADLSGLLQLEEFKE